MKLTKVQIKKIEKKNNIRIMMNSDGEYQYNNDRAAEYGWQYVTPEMVDEIRGREKLIIKKTLIWPVCDLRRGV